MGLSGGADSAAAALLLKNEARRIVAATMWLYDGQDAELERAARCAVRLGVEHRVYDFRREFEQSVVSRYISQYERGLTPNPCVLCNIEVKYGAFLDAIDTDYLALGHYARVARIDGEYRIFRSSASRKDQSYNLYHLNQSQLSRLLFPLGGFSSKAETLSMAAPYVDAGTESMGTCFLKGDTRLEFFRARGLRCAERGQFFDKDGNSLGSHQGCAGFTIGQRPKVRKAANADGMTSPYEVLGTVVQILPEERAVIIGGEDDVMKRSIRLKNVNIISQSRRAEIESAGGLSVSVRLSQWSEVYRGVARSKRADCSVATGRAESVAAAESLSAEQQYLTFDCDAFMRAPAGGQAAVLYIGDELIGGGTIV